MVQVLCCDGLSGREGKGRFGDGAVALVEGAGKQGSRKWRVGTGHWGLGTGQATNLIRSSYCTVLYTT